MSMIIACGQTPPGSTNWQQYQGSTPGIYVDVNTASAGFATTPVYITSLGGINGNRATTGGNSVYHATATGFRVYVRFYNGDPITPDQANSNQWHINWIAVRQ